MTKFLFIIAILAFVIAFGFGATKVLQSKNTPVEASQKQKVTVLLDWYPNTNHTGLYVAKDKGYYAAENLDVKIIQPSEDEATQVIGSNKADFAISSQESVTLARVKDIPVVSLAAILQHNTSVFASLAKENIKTPKDFEGKRYGGWGSPIEEATIKSLMEDAGADYTKVKTITLGSSDFLTTIGRDSDFQWVFYGWEVMEAKQKGIAVNTIVLKDLNPILDYYTPVLITNQKHIATQADLVKRFMAATAKGYTFASAHPDESAAILLKNAPELNKDLVNQSQKYLSTQYIADAKSWGIQKKEVWKGYADWLFAHKLLDKNIDTTKAFTNEFLH